jgi:hypothetical protein
MKQNQPSQTATEAGMCLGQMFCFAWFICLGTDSDLINKPQKPLEEHIEHENRIVGNLKPVEIWGEGQESTPGL